jgi:hypothetical protein
MTFERLPATVQTLYIELLEQALQDEAAGLARGLPAGVFVVKEIKGHRYWYLQVAVGAQRHQRYLGRETPELLRWMAETASARAERAPDQAGRARLAAMLVQGGAAAPPASLARVLTVLSELGVFRRGGVLVGTHAYANLANLLGVRFPAQTLATQDLDVVHDLAIAWAASQEESAGVERGLVEAGLGFLPVPALDPRLPATSFKVRGQELRVDFLVPTGRGREAGRPVRVPGLGVSAQPLPFLEFLLEDVQAAVVPRGSGIVVRVPTPARFALHKLWLARERPATEAARATKDRRQALALLGVLAEDRPGDLLLAWDALARRKSARKVIETELSRWAPEVRALVADGFSDRP